MKNGSLRHLQSVLKNVIEEALVYVYKLTIFTSHVPCRYRSDMAMWALQFQLHLANMYSREHDYVKYISCLKEAGAIAVKVGKVEEVAMIVARAQCHLLEHDYKNAALALLEGSSAASDLAANSQDSRRATLVHLHHLAVDTLLHIQLGHMEEAKQKLHTLMQKVEAVRKARDVS
jgi:hypothetical protein